MMARAASGLVIAALACGCGTTPTPETVSPQPVASQPLTPGAPPKPAVVAALKATAAKSFKDPYSARWTGLQQAIRPNARGEPTDIVCGYVNSKNSFGAYIGERPFVYLVENRHLAVRGEGDDIMRPVLAEIVRNFCTGLI